MKYKRPMSLPTLSLLPDHLSELSESFEDMFSSLEKYFTFTQASNDDDIEGARSVAAVLEGELHSSDIDCDYYPCTLLGVDPLSDEFFAALGVTRDERADVGGYDNPKLEVTRAKPGEGEGSAIALFTRLSASALEELSEYLGPDGKEVYEAAIARLEAFGPIVGVQLCADDGASKLLLTLARRPNGVHVGVLTIAVET